MSSNGGGAAILTKLATRTAADDRFARPDVAELTNRAGDIAIVGKKHRLRAVVAWSDKERSGIAAGSVGCDSVSVAARSKQHFWMTAHADCHAPPIPSSTKSKAVATAPPARVDVIA
jgi:hypothetical protein